MLFGRLRLVFLRMGMNRDFELGWLEPGFWFGMAGMAGLETWDLYTHVGKPMDCYFILFGIMGWS